MYVCSPIVVMYLVLLVCYMIVVLYPRERAKHNSLKNSYTQTLTDARKEKVSPVLLMKMFFILLKTSKLV